MIDRHIDKILKPFFVCFVLMVIYNNQTLNCLPNSNDRQNTSIFNDSTEDAEDTGHDKLINSIQPR